MKYFGGCDVGSTYTKCVILDENGKMVANVTNRSKITAFFIDEFSFDAGYFQQYLFYYNHKIFHLVFVIIVS